VWQLVVFCVGTVGLVAVSWRCLHDPRSHGFPRFFAWEAILAVLLLNVESWFDHPLSVTQLISWVLLVASLVCAGLGFRLLRTIGHEGQPGPGQDQQAGPGHREPVEPGGADYAFENTSRLVDVGLYRYLRHPLYASLLYLVWGACLKDPSLVAVGLSVLASVLLWLTALAEERENVVRFGEAYTAYVARTWRFVPFLV